MRRDFAATGPNRVWLSDLTEHATREGKLYLCAIKDVWSFFALLQKNVLDKQSWDNREQLRIAIVTWIERTYHRRRRQAALGRLTPIGYELIVNQTAEMAA